MKLINEDCGCDDDYFSVINNSPLLNGDQEMAFNNSFNDINNNNTLGNKPLTKPIVFERSTNNINNNPVQIPKVELDAITQNKINNNNIAMNNNNQNNSLNLTAMNNQMNNHQMNNQMNNRQMNNPAMNNQMNNPNSLNSMENINLSQAINNIENNLNNDVSDNTSYKILVTNLNYVLMVVLALALNDIAKFYINRSIKFQNGNHKYYIYYLVGLVIVVYLITRVVNKIN
jgi:hypothetical protein